MGENPSFLLGPIFLFVKLVCVASVLSVGLGGGKQLLGTGVVVGNSISSTGLLCAIYRRD